MSSNSLLEVNEFVMKKKILSIRERYDIEDKMGKKLGEADGNIVQLPPMFAVLDLNGSELMHLTGKLITLRNEFSFFDAAGIELGVIKKKIVKLIGEEFWVERDGVEFMRIYGDFTVHEYKMEVGSVEVASVHKRWVAVRDEFEVTIVGNVDHRIVLGALIAIEHVEVTQRIQRQNYQNQNYQNWSHQNQNYQNRY